VSACRADRRDPRAGHRACGPDKRRALYPPGVRYGPGVRRALRLQRDLRADGGAILCRAPRPSALVPGVQRCRRPLQRLRPLHLAAVHLQRLHVQRQLRRRERQSRQGGVRVRPAERLGAESEGWHPRLHPQPRARLGGKERHHGQSQGRDRRRLSVRDPHEHHRLRALHVRDRLRERRRDGHRQRSVREQSAGIRHLRQYERRRGALRLARLQSRAPEPERRMVHTHGARNDHPHRDARTDARRPRRDVVPLRDDQRYDPLLRLGLRRGGDHGVLLPCEHEPEPGPPRVLRLGSLYRRDG